MVCAVGCDAWDCLGGILDLPVVMRRERGIWAGVILVTVLLHSSEYAALCMRNMIIAPL